MRITPGLVATAVIGAACAVVLAASATTPAGAPIVFPTRTTSSAAPSPSPSVSPSASPSPSPSPSPAQSKKPPGSAPPPATGVFSRVASGGTGVMGSGSDLTRYCVRLEDGINLDVDGIAAIIDSVLGHEKSWIASNHWAFQRIGTCDGANLRIHVAVPSTVDRLCRPAADTAGRYSCHNRGNIYLNLNRWTSAVPHFPDLGVYRVMVVNHEVGHFLGKGHVFCKGAGQMAGVMQQQSISLQGCTINPYPYPDGVNYYS